MLIETEIRGVPCVVKVHHVLEVPGHAAWASASDLDFYGYTEVIFDVCDAAGNPLKELEASLTEDELNDLERLIVAAGRKSDHEVYGEDEYF